MAQASLVPRNGSITLGNYVADFNAFTLRVAQGVEGVTPFGTNKASKNVGAGTPDLAFSVSAAALAGGGTGAPGLGGYATGTPQGMWSPSHTCVLQLDTGITESFGAVVGDYSIGVARMRAAVPVSISGKNAGEITEVWLSDTVMT